MAMLRHIWWWVRWRRRCIVSHDACDRLFRPYLFLKRLAEPEELPALDVEMCQFSPSILVEVGVPGTPPVQQFFCRGWWLVTMPTPLRLWPRIAAGTSAATSVVCVPLPRSIVVVVMVVIYVACCYHVCCVQSPQRPQRPFCRTNRDPECRWALGSMSWSSER
jgi:hypothetical protein